MPVGVKLFDRYSIQKKTWFEAKDYCRAIGGDLLSIHSSVELQSVPRYSIKENRTSCYNNNNNC